MLCVSAVPCSQWQVRKYDVESHVRYTEVESQVEVERHVIYSEDVEGQVR